MRIRAIAVLLLLTTPGAACGGTSGSTAADADDADTTATADTDTTATADADADADGAEPVYGGGAADGVACAGAFVVAGVTGALRVASDQHYLSDVLVGATVGTLVGLGLPWLLHYRFGAADAGAADADLAPAPLAVSLVSAAHGAALIGVF